MFNTATCDVLISDLSVTYVTHSEKHFKCHATNVFSDHSAITIVTRNPKVICEKAVSLEYCIGITWFLERSTNCNAVCVKYLAYLAFHPNEWVHQMASWSIEPFLHCSSIVQYYLVFATWCQSVLRVNTRSVKPAQICWSNGISISF